MGHQVHAVGPVAVEDVHDPVSEQGPGSGRVVHVHPQPAGPVVSDDAAPIGGRRHEHDDEPVGEAEAEERLQHVEEARCPVAEALCAIRRPSAPGLHLQPIAVDVLKQRAPTTEGERRSFEAWQEQAADSRIEPRAVARLPRMDGAPARREGEPHDGVFDVGLLARDEEEQPSRDDSEVGREQPLMTVPAQDARGDFVTEDDSPAMAVQDREVPIHPPRPERLARSGVGAEDPEATLVRARQRA